MRFALLCAALATVFHSGLLPQAQARPEGAPIFQDVTLRVTMDKDLAVFCEFTSKAKDDQKFMNTEYRVAILDKDGAQVDGALAIGLPLREITVAAGKVTKDKSDASIFKDKLVKGQAYYVVINVRNLTGLVKFTAP